MKEKYKPTCTTYYGGTKRWHLNGLAHREDGPAIEHFNGAKNWMRHGLLHREDGPALESRFGNEWYLNDRRYTEEDYWKELFNRGKITEKELFLKLL
jgi:hypothetical protein